MGIVRGSKKYANERFWGITTIFNPQQYSNKISNYRKFRGASKKQGLNLITVELAFGNDKFALNKKDADILIQVRGNSVMWQKERLMNIALKNLPKSCDKIAWIDADIIFTDNCWIEKASKLLEKYKVIQLFDSAIKMSRGKDYVNPQEAGFSNSFFDEDKKSVAVVFNYLNKKQAFGQYGYAWAARREVFEGMGFYDRAILGSGDLILNDAFFQDIPKRNQYLDFSDLMLKDINLWQDKIKKIVQGNVGYLPGTLLHLWHGSSVVRGYKARYIHSKKYNFDPNFDIKLNPYGVWEWASDKNNFHEFIRRYFMIRNEENKLSLKQFILRGAFMDYFNNYLSERYHGFMGLAGIKLNRIFPRIYKFIKRFKS